MVSRKDASNYFKLWENYKQQGKDIFDTDFTDSSTQYIKKFWSFIRSAKDVSEETARIYDAIKIGISKLKAANKTASVNVDNLIKNLNTLSSLSVGSEISLKFSLLANYIYSCASEYDKKKVENISKLLNEISEGWKKEAHQLFNAHSDKWWFPHNRKAAALIASFFSNISGLPNESKLTKEDVANYWLINKIYKNLNFSPIRETPIDKLKEDLIGVSVEDIVFVNVLLLYIDFKIENSVVNFIKNCGTVDTSTPTLNKQDIIAQLNKDVDLFFVKLFEFFKDNSIITPRPSIDLAQMRGKWARLITNAELKIESVAAIAREADYTSISYELENIVNELREFKKDALKVLTNVDNLIGAKASGLNNKIIDEAKLAISDLLMVVNNDSDLLIKQLADTGLESRLDSQTVKLIKSKTFYNLLLNIFKNVFNYLRILKMGVK